MAFYFVIFSQRCFVVNQKNEIDPGWIFPENPFVKSMVGRLERPDCVARCFRCGFDADPGKWHNRLGFYAPLEYELLFLIRGEAEFTDEYGRTSHVSGGTVIQRFPRKPTCLRYDPEDQIAVTCYITVPEELFMGLKFCGALASEDSIITYYPDSVLIRRLQRIFFALKNSSASEIPAVSAQIYEFLVFAHRHIRWSTFSDSSLKQHEKACAILSERVDEKVLLPDIAKEMGMSYRSFRRLFESILGISPGQYLIKLRIERAKDLLESGKAPREVAELLNYPDVYTFSRQFKRFSGISPAQYCR